MNRQLILENIGVSYADVTAVNHVSLQLEKGQIGSLIGPSGCGKTSLLRAIAGFEPINAGAIQLAGKQVSSASDWLPPEKRHVGMVFQDFALFPHLTVEKNIAFGLRKANATDSKKRITSLLEMIGLKDYAGSYPHELSGGQQQRVALARAIAPQPEILLMDEPFSSLDAELREHIAEEVRCLLKEHNITAIMVTHDQHEAFAMADVIGIMQDGNLLQWDTPYTLYHNPKNRFIAGFIGEGTVLTAYVNQQGELKNGLGILAPANGWDQHSEYEILLRPDDLIYEENGNFKLEIISKLFRGAEFFYRLKLPDNQTALCVTPSHIDRNIGDFLTVKPDIKHLVIFSKS